MTSFRATWVWAVLILGLAGYSYWDYRQNRNAPELQSGERMAFTLKRDEVKQIVFTRGTTTIEMKREDDEWHILKPVDDWAEDSVVDGFLFGIMGERLRTFREDAGAPDWAKYGLTPPGVTVELATDKAREKIEVSSKNAFDGSFYVRQKDELVAGSASLAQTTNREVNSFRSKRIWRHADADVTKVTARGDGADFTLAREKGAWTLSPKPKFAIDPERIDKWVNAVEDLNAAEIVKDGVDDRKPFLLDKPRYQVAIDYKAPDQKAGRWDLTIGREKGTDVHLFTNDRAAILKIAAPTVRKVLATPEYFRDGHEPFKFDAEAARTVDIAGPKLKLTAKREGAAWTLVNPKEGQSLDESAFRDLIAALGGLKAVDFAGPKPKGPPIVRVKDAAGKTLLQLIPGDEYSPKTPWNDGAKLRAVSLGAAETFGLPKAQIDTLIKDTLVKTAKPKNTSEAPVSK